MYSSKNIIYSTEFHIVTLLDKKYYLQNIHESLLLIWWMQQKCVIVFDSKPWNHQPSSG